MPRFKGTKIAKVLKKDNLFNFLYFERNHSIENTIIISGTGRSGTTWLAEILLHFFKHRILFEPFNPKKVKLCENFFNKQYIPPNYQDSKYYEIFHKILTGKVRSLWVNQDNHIFRPSGRIIKTIRASLFLKWLKNNFPSVPIIYILRHPCAVAESRTRLNWATSDVDIILQQENLMKDHLSPFKDILSKAKSQIQRNACIWCVENFVALNTMEKNDWLITTYENLYMNPKSEVNKILHYLNYEDEFKPELIKKTISLTTKKDSAILSMHNPIEAWKNKLSLDEINQIMEIVEFFSLDSIYDRDFLPKKFIN